MTSSPLEDGPAIWAIGQAATEAELGVLEAAHIRPVRCDGPDRLSNALALCPTHHAMFDEGLWSVDGSRIVFCKKLSLAVRKTFRGEIHCKWQPDSDACDWHRKNIFRLGGVG